MDSSFAACSAKIALSMSLVMMPWLARLLLRPSSPAPACLNCTDPVKVSLILCLIFSITTLPYLILTWQGYTKTPSRPSLQSLGTAKYGRTNGLAGLLHDHLVVRQRHEDELLDGTHLQTGKQSACIWALHSPVLCCSTTTSLSDSAMRMSCWMAPTCTQAGSLHLLHAAWVAKATC